MTGVFCIKLKMFSGNALPAGSNWIVTKIVGAVRPVRCVLTSTNTSRGSRSTTELMMDRRATSLAYAPSVRRLVRRGRWNNHCCWLAESPRVVITVPAVNVRLILIPCVGSARSQSWITVSVNRIGAEGISSSIVYGLLRVKALGCGLNHSIATNHRRTTFWTANQTDSTTGDSTCFLSSMATRMASFTGNAFNNLAAEISFNDAAINDPTINNAAFNSTTLTRRTNLSVSRLSKETQAYGQHTTGCQNKLFHCSTYFEKS